MQSKSSEELKHLFYFERKTYDFYAELGVIFDIQFCQVYYDVGSVVYLLAYICFKKL